MWLVRFVLRRPYTFVVVAFLIAVLGILSTLSMPTDQSWTGVRSGLETKVP